MNHITELHQVIDALDARLARTSADLGKPVTCPGKGCCACCSEPVYCSSYEAHHLLEELSEEQKLRVTARLTLALEKVKASGLFKKDLPHVMEWLSLKSPCPLLEGGSCMAYERRPVSCRSHMACGPPEWCSTKRLEQKYPQAKEHSLAAGNAILLAHLKVGNTITHDNLLALLEKELLGEYHETASAQQIVFTEEETKKAGNNPGPEKGQ